MNSGESLDSQSLPGGIFPEHMNDFSVAGKAAERMETNEQRILDLIRKGEGLNLEFKTCRERLNRDVYETVCAFLNRHGGTILLGVQDSGEDRNTRKAASFASGKAGDRWRTPGILISIS